MIRACHPGDFQALHRIILAAAQAYRGIIPPDCWREPYMSQEELRDEMEAGVAFWGYEQDGGLIGVMGIQAMKEVSLIRHAYMRTSTQRMGVGGLLLLYLKQQTEKPLLVGTWADARWAICFYEKHGFHLVSKKKKTAFSKHTGRFLKGRLKPQWFLETQNGFFP